VRRYSYVLLVAAIAIAVVQSLDLQQKTQTPESRAPDVAARDVREDSDGLLARAFEERRSNLQVHGRGTVLKVLADDLKGSRHQRFLLQLDSGQTLLIAHNIDLAPRLDSLRAGDEVSFCGEYEWNDKGGVIHWTHHDPDGTHPGGWLEHRGRRYE
jgi:hypothetical protein